MSWASHHTREMATAPPGRHRRGGRRPLPGTGILAAGIVLVVLAALAMVVPSVVGWPPTNHSVAGSGDPSPTPERALGPAQPTATPATVTPTATPSDAPTTTTPPPSTRTTTRPARRDEPGVDPTLVALEDQVFELTNKERAKEGCSALRLDDRLRKAARMHSADMINSGYFGHTSPDGRDPGDRLAEVGYPTNGGWAENIARGYPSAKAVMEGWMNSDGHRANILNCRLKAIGVGVARAGNGRLYWTQDFGGR